MNRRTSILVISAGLAGASSALAQAGFVGGYELQNWRSLGIFEGTTEIIPSSGSATTADFSYDVNLGSPGGPGVSFRTADFINIAPASGNVSFDWDYIGMHAWFQATLIFEIFSETSAGRVTEEVVFFGTPTGGGNFSFLGTVTDWPIEEGMEWGITIGGSNFDSTSILRGTMTLSSFNGPAGGGACPCACNFDTSTGQDICDLFDFLAFQDGFVGADPCACDIDTTTGPGVCDLFDFLAFQDEFVSGCP